LDNFFKTLLGTDEDSDALGAVDVRLIVPRETAINIILVAVFIVLFATIIKKVSR